LGRALSRPIFSLLLHRSKWLPGSAQKSDQLGDSDHTTSRTNKKPLAQVTGPQIFVNFSYKFGFPYYCRLA
jgi:hypothetical protein